MGSVFGQSLAYRRKARKSSEFVKHGVVKHPKRHEELLQIKISNYIKREYPQAILIGDFAAGLELTDTQRIKMMAMRSEQGQPDISVDFPSRGYHGLRLELKAEGTTIYKKDGTLRKSSYTRKYKRNGKILIHRGDHLAEQEATLKKYLKLGYFARFAVGEDDAIKLIDWYFERPVNNTLF